MVPAVKSAPTKWEMEFLGEPLAELPNDHLPTLGEVFRYFYHHRQTLPRNTRKRDVAALVNGKCIEIWRNFGIPTALGHNLTRTLVKLLSLFKSVQYFKKEEAWRRTKKEALWRRKLESVYNIAAHDAMKKCSRKNRKLLQAAEREVEELKDMERSMSWKRKLDEVEMPAVTGVGEPAKKRARAKRKIEDSENGEHDVKRCKVLLAKLEAPTDSDDAHKRKDVLKTRNANGRANELGSRSGLLDVQPDDEDIVPPNLPCIIIKEELDINWNENDNVQTFFASYDEYSFENCSFEKESVLSDKLGLHSFIENNSERFQS